MSKVVLKGFILVPESELGLVNSELIDHKRLTLEEEGCITFQVIENPLRFDAYEEFIDRAAFEYYPKRVTTSRWGKITTHVQRYYEVFE
ncbi:antibiotic biosynthesis monooxygenase [Vibrio pectenicida]|uniref:Antibiotic biosynthesis monooxygenase n=1 Tax=Vibrio pectenicida TaxID=62763 RepID=A0A7Y4EE86_9VIBR|nr:antibiotic biosynthesis monooxygenase [Vibrio pectenicida]NOH71197.1 antibiotic biosynthesis monooxygenase [Vibrio pectenicida]